MSKTRTMNELMPCPFCGSSCVNDTTPPDPVTEGFCFWVCPCCASCGPNGASEGEATELWNARADINYKDIKPSTCIGDPMSCETNEGYGCYCTDKGLVDYRREAK